MLKNKGLADLLLLVVAFIWGATFVVVQDAIEAISPFAFLAIRFAIAAIFLFFISKKAELFTQRILLCGMLLGFFVFLGYALQTFALLYTTSGKAGFLTGANVVFVPLLSFFLLKEKLSPSVIAGVLATFVGLYLLSVSDFQNINYGDLLALGCAIAFALQIIYTKVYASTLPIPPLVTVQTFTVFLLSGLGSLLFEPWQQMYQLSILLQPKVLSAILITSIFATVFAFLVQTYVQKYTSPTRVALIFATEPIFAALGDYVWNGITLDTRSLIGCTLILAGILLSELPIKKKSSSDLQKEPESR